MPDPPPNSKIALARHPSDKHSIRETAESRNRSHLLTEADRNNTDSAPSAPGAP